MIDIHSTTWKTVEQWALKEISNAQAGLEYSTDQTTLMRYQGRIGALRELLRLEGEHILIAKEEDYL